MAGGPKLAVTLSVFNRKAAPHVPFEAEPLVENTPMSNVVIAGYARSPFAQANKGELVRVRPDELAAQTIKGLLERTKIDPDAIEDLILGCAFPEGEQGLNLGRIVGFLAGLPRTVGGATVNRFCGSSMRCAWRRRVAMGAGEASSAPGSSPTCVPTGLQSHAHPALAKNYPRRSSMGETAENPAA